MGMTRGRFVPALGYEEFRPLFGDLADAEPENAALPYDKKRLAQCRARVEAITLTLESADGVSIETDGISLVDFGKLAGDEGREVEAYMIDPASAWTSTD